MERTGLNPLLANVNFINLKRNAQNTQKLETIYESGNIAENDTTEMRMEYIGVLNEFPDLKEMFIKKLKVAIQKIGSNSKTKVINKLISNDKCKIGYGAFDYIKMKSVPGKVYSTGNTIDSIVIDINYINDELNRSVIYNKIKLLQNQITEKEKYKTVIDELVEFKLNKIEAQIKITLQEILNGIDYQKAVDSYYYLFLKELVKQSYTGKGREKIFLLGKDLFDILVEKTLNGLSISDVRYDDVKIISAFLFMKNYLKESNNNILKNLSDSFGNDKIETFFNPEHSSAIKLNDYDSIYDFGKLMAQKDILNITNNAFKQRMKRIAGDKIDDLFDLNFEDFVSYLISCNYPNQLFNGLTIDKDRQERLEKLVLNFKSNIII